MTRDQIKEVLRLSAVAQRAAFDYHRFNVWPFEKNARAKLDVAIDQLVAYLESLETSDDAPKECAA